MLLNYKIGIPLLGDAVLVDGALRNIGGFGVEVVESMENNVILFTPYENLAVVSGLTVTLTTAAQDSRAVAKQATYHFMMDDVDFIIREPKALAYFGLTAGSNYPRDRRNNIA